MIKIERIEQRGLHDCQIAVCAMILGVSYDEARAHYPAKIGRGFSELYIDNILVEHGYAIARKYHANCAAGRKREPWPPKPWGDLHFAHVENAAGIHAVVVLADGTVIDPYDARRKRLDGYKAVNFVAAVVPLATKIEASR